ncbi:DUF2169 domain-containing protein [Caballeronia sp. GaOx3]|uniref:DUF2169 family type VI secretion system accessory protein n=1 Tax=Caballeronia sp. GaOx3 TaxID=2921740 RepID=UPI0020282BCD|nr:DUF2169 domain-containing protein [Caballeronia sp. GaOx3]
MSIAVPLHNWTPFAADSLVLPDPDGQEILSLVVSATFVIGVDGRLECAVKQPPMLYADVSHGVPGLSSIMQEADVAIEKRRVDVIVNAAAYAPKGRTSERVVVAFAVGDVRKQLVVSGDREWRAGLRGQTASAPKPFLRMPIVYERAFGGARQSADESAGSLTYAFNPVGVGFHGARSADPAVTTEMPNVEDPHNLITRRGDVPPHAGIGVVARVWAPRAGRAGTYDDEWLKSRWPCLPKDFDPSFYQCAPDDQQSSTLVGGETFQTLNLTPEGAMAFRLPRLSVPVRLYFDDRLETLMLRVDTVVLDCDSRSLVLRGRIAVRTVRNAPRLRQIIVGHPTSGCLRAFANHKRFLANRDVRPLQAFRHFAL